MKFPSHIKMSKSTSPTKGGKGSNHTKPKHAICKSLDEVHWRGNTGAAWARSSRFVSSLVILSFFKSGGARVCLIRRGRVVQDARSSASLMCLSN